MAIHLVLVALMVYLLKIALINIIWVTKLKTLNIRLINIGESMKKYLLGIVLIIAVIFVFGCITDSGSINGTKAPKTIAKNGILLKYPGTWVVADSGANDSIVAVADPKSKDDGSGFSVVNVNIERKELPSSLESYFNQTYSKLFFNSDSTPIAQGNASVGEYNALEYIYTQNSDGTMKKHRALWIENNNKVYVILFTAPEENFDSQSKNFDFIISSFKIT
ncbi:hypothetical protein ALNOE001_19880 [Candidatus Methanobinarius endosymbioticus]|uniref:PsbP C-terminal domain-containing protein n=1 Tax=Candidatus Methanobinarius endosymbioticus TaxID=2006182 RepID=A0A366M9J4_9EURY|nr:hypothetical protein ALNOE001_19880 [Candidatus Methanobinarius endosymbioticus]